MKATENVRYYNVLLLFIALLVFGNVLQNQFALDDFYITENKFVQDGFSGIADVLTEPYTAGADYFAKESYRPLTLLTFAVEYELTSLSPFSGHLVNLCLYLAVLLVLFHFFRLLFATKEVILPFLGALLFLAHPAHSEVVANVKSRDELLVALFGLLSFIAWLNYLKSTDKKQLYRAMLFYFGALMSKENALAFIAIYPLLAWFHCADFKLNRKKGLLFFVPFSVYLIARFAVIGSFTLNAPVEFTNNVLANAGWQEQIATRTYMLGHYLYTTIIAYPLMWDYSYAVIEPIGFSDIRFFLSFFALLAIVLATLALGKKHPMLALGVAFYFITLGISSNTLILISSNFGERFLFVPTIGYSLVVIYLLHKFIEERYQQQRNGRRIMIGVFAFIFLSYGLVATARNKAWKDNITLFEADIKHNSNSAKAYAALGSAYRIEAEKSKGLDDKNMWLKKAVDAYTKCLEIYPDYAETYYNLGVTYGLAGNKKEAARYYNISLTYNPNRFEVLNNLGVIYLDVNKIDSAKMMFEHILQLDDEYPGALVNLGLIYLNASDFTRAKANFEKVLKNDVRNTTAMYNMGIVFFNTKKYNDAIEYFKAIPTGDVNYSNALANIGYIYLLANKLDAAAQQCELAMQANQYNGYAANLLVMIYDRLGNGVKKAFYEEYGRKLKEQ